jgi:hypothetical protein
MGLDNIPAEYPCSKAGTATLTPKLNRDGTPFLDENGRTVESIDCEQTQDNGGCPWLAADPPSAGRVTGIFGAPCWYRGKHGNYLLEDVLGISYDETEGISFFGSDEDGTRKSAEECFKLATYIEDAIVATTWVEDPSKIDYLETGIEAASIEDKDDCVYAAWWLRWVAEHGDGTICWY